MPKKTGIDTRERILQTSIKLFNRDGLKRVSVNRVAEELDISPGNLTYHFKRKKDLIAEIVDRLEVELQEALLAFPFPGEAEAYAQSMLRIYRVLWRYRFVFKGLHYVVQMDVAIEQRFGRLQESAVSTIRREADDAVAAEYMRPFEAPNSSQLFAENLWGLWMNWVCMFPYSGRVGRVSEKAALYDCAVHHVSLVQPYMGHRFAGQVYAAFRAACGMAPVSSAKPALRKAG